MRGPVIESLLVVCAGNICRSPMAEALFRHRLTGRSPLDQITIGSAGTIAYNGNLPCADSVEVMYERFGIDISAHRAQTVQRAAPADLVLTMDRRTTTAVEAIGIEAPVRMLGDFVGTGEEVDDPYGRPRKAYQRTADQIDRLVDTAIANLAEGDFRPES
jgi:protein-tyrosine phosphatase